MPRPASQSCGLKALPWNAVFRGGPCPRAGPGCRSGLSARSSRPCRRRPSRGGRHRVVRDELVVTRRCRKLVSISRSAPSGLSSVQVRVVFLLGCAQRRAVADRAASLWLSAEECVVAIVAGTACPRLSHRKRTRPPAALRGGRHAAADVRRHVAFGKRRRLASAARAGFGVVTSRAVKRRSSAGRCFAVHVTPLPAAACAARPANSAFPVIAAEPCARCRGLSLTFVSPLAVAVRSDDDRPTSRAARIHR